MELEVDVEVMDAEGAEGESASEVPGGAFPLVDPSGHQSLDCVHPVSSHTPLLPCSLMGGRSGGLHFLPEDVNVKPSWNSTDRSRANVSCQIRGELRLH